jgi:hypothetical protein
MAIGIYIRPESMDEAQYNEIMSKLNAALGGPPKGRLDHICFGSGTGLQVFDVWDSQASFDKFGETLMPILDAIGLKMGEPMIEPIVNTVTR